MIEAVTAAAVVGIVLIEAVVLYVGYGYLEDVATPPVLRAVKSV